MTEPKTTQNYRIKEVSISNGSDIIQHAFYPMNRREISKPHGMWWWKKTETKIVWDFFYRHWKTAEITTNYGLLNELAYFNDIGDAVMFIDGLKAKDEKFFKANILGRLKSSDQNEFDNSCIKVKYHE